MKEQAIEEFQETGIIARNSQLRRFIVAAKWRMVSMYCLLVPCQRKVIMMVMVCIREVVQWVTLNKYLVSRIWRT